MTDDQSTDTKAGPQSKLADGPFEDRERPRPRDSIRFHPGVLFVRGLCTALLGAFILGIVALFWLDTAFGWPTASAVGSIAALGLIRLPKTQHDADR